MKLSPTMRAACLAALGADGKLYRHPGGYWTPARSPPCRHSSTSECIRHGWFSTNTARAVVARGAGFVSRWQPSKLVGSKPFETEITVHPFSDEDVPRAA